MKTIRIETKIIQIVPAMYPIWARFDNVGSDVWYEQVQLWALLEDCTDGFRYVSALVAGSEGIVDFALDSSNFDGLTITPPTKESTYRY